MLIILPYPKGCGLPVSIWQLSSAAECRRTRRDKARSSGAVSVLFFFRMYLPMVEICTFALSFSSERLPLETLYADK